MPDEIEVVHVHGVRQRDHVTDQMFGAVVARFGRAGTAAVAALIGRNRATAGVSEGPQLVAPGPRGLGEAVEAQDAPPIVGPTRTPGEREAAGLDFDPVNGPGYVGGRHRCVDYAETEPPLKRASSGVRRRASSSMESTRLRCAT